MASSHKLPNRYNISEIAITATRRFWRWQAKKGSRIVAQQTGNFPRDVPDEYARRFARLKAQEWLLEKRATRTDLRFARSVHQGEGAAA